jgi:acetoin utilization deacetylase AcuC-like enzyme
MPRTAFVYHDGYDLQFGDHVFPSVKYKMLRDRLVAEGFLDVADFYQPESATDEDLELVHTADWVRKLKTGTLSYGEIMKLEIPYSQAVVKAFWLAAGGTILASKLALEHGVGFNIGGGFHHAFAAHGEGFCAIHDVAVAIRRLQKDGLIERAMVVDCDVHHGNGTAAIFAGDRSVFTMSIHQFNNYPDIKPPSTIDIHLDDGTGDSDYLRRLSDAVSLSVPGFKPDMLFYVAGADPFAQDQLGGLNLTFEGLKARDQLVFENALRCRVPVVVTLAGGYAINVDDTITIHHNTAEMGECVLKDMGYEPRGS